MSDFLKPEDFYQQRNRHVFRAMLSLFTDGKPIDYHSTADALQQQGEGDEAIVLCKVFIADTVKTQFGRAPIGGGVVAGSSGGVPFRLGAADSGIEEAKAFRRATEAALAKCLELIGGE